MQKEYTQRWYRPQSSRIEVLWNYTWYWITPPQYPLYPVGCLGSAVQDYCWRRVVVTWRAPEMQE